jgi:hypothetical protein
MDETYEPPVFDLEADPQLGLLSQFVSVESPIIPPDFHICYGPARFPCYTFLLAPQSVVLGQIIAAGVQVEFFLPYESFGDERIVGLVVSFMSGQLVKISCQNFENLWDIAEFLQVTSLLGHIQTFMNTLSVVKQCQNPDVIARYFMIFSLDPEVRQFTPEFVQVLLRHPDFTIRNEDEFALWAIRYCRSDPERADLLDEIRAEDLSPIFCKFLLEEIRGGNKQLLKLVRARLTFDPMTGWHPPHRTDSRTNSELMTALAAFPLD